MPYKDSNYHRGCQMVGVGARGDLTTLWAVRSPRAGARPEDAPRKTHGDVGQSRLLHGQVAGHHAARPETTAAVF